MILYSYSAKKICNEGVWIDQEKVNNYWKCYTSPIRMVEEIYDRGIASDKTVFMGVEVDENHSSYTVDEVFDNDSVRIITKRFKVLKHYSIAEFAHICIKHMEEQNNHDFTKVNFK